MKREVCVGRQGSLILAVSAYLNLTASKKNPLSQPGQCVIKRSLLSGGSSGAGKLTDTIKQLGGMENMGPDIMAQSVKQEVEVTARSLEKEVVEETVDKIFGKAHTGTCGAPIGQKCSHQAYSFVFCAFIYLLQPHNVSAAVAAFITRTSLCTGETSTWLRKLSYSVLRSFYHLSRVLRKQASTGVALII
uniref:Uncharacterized protein n=1 Tax=Branchiostoma floridae TaxID=7739 RepID=C3YI40_BRAFL|eukprot:XP_002604166.1 hypothetical protein BRAFLDRAFT_71535 [Branchiostoma floridae]